MLSLPILHTRMLVQCRCRRDTVHARKHAPEIRNATCGGYARSCEDKHTAFLPHLQAVKQARNDVPEGPRSAGLQRLLA